MKENNGIGFTGLLQILFIGLKLGNVIDWSWWWIFSPLWISFIIFLFVFAIIILFALKTKIV